MISAALSTAPSITAGVTARHTASATAAATPHAAPTTTAAVTGLGGSAGRRSHPRGGRSHAGAVQPWASRDATRAAARPGPTAITATCQPDTWSASTTPASVQPAASSVNARACAAHTATVNSRLPTTVADAAMDAGRATHAARAVQRAPYPAVATPAPASPTGRTTTGTGLSNPPKPDEAVAASDAACPTAAPAATPATAGASSAARQRYSGSRETSPVTSPSTTGTSRSGPRAYQIPRASQDSATSRWARCASSWRTPAPPRGRGCARARCAPGPG